MDRRPSEWSEYSSIVSSRLFASPTNSTRLLKYVCDKHFAGAEHVSETEIAVEVLGRRPDFDPQQDSIVRVEAHRLRKRLHVYYEREGSEHPYRLVLPHGTYLPSFVAVTAEQTGEEQEVLTAGGAPANPAPPPAPPGKNEPAKRKKLLLALACALILMAAVAFVLHSRTSHRAYVAGAPISESPAPATLSPDLLIMAGSSAKSYTDQIGHIWSGDRYFAGGESWVIPYRRIWRTDDPQLFLTARQGEDFGYDIPLKRGTYQLRLYFAETFYGPDNSEGGGESSRMFDVTANGVPLLSDFDPLSDAGGSNTADVRVFAGISPSADGKLHLRFHNHWQLKGVAFVNAIEITPGSGAMVTPVRWVAADSAVVDRNGQLWLPDRFVEGGRRRELADAIGDTKDPELFKSERYGNFNYAIPVVTNRTYTLTLYFAEHWFGLPHQAPLVGSGVGLRQFDVYCNGLYLLRDFDIYKQAGGSLRAMTMTFHGLEPNHQGKILLSFVPAVNYATVTALELTAESRVR